MDQQLGDKVLKDIKSDFMVQGTHRVHNWYAYAIIGIVFGLAVGIIYVANRNAKFDASQAAEIKEPPYVPGDATNNPTSPYRSSIQNMPTDILATLQPEEVIKATKQDNGSTVLTGPGGQVLKLISDGEGGKISRDGNNMLWVPTGSEGGWDGTIIKLENGQSMGLGLDPKSSNGIIGIPQQTSPNKPPVPVYGCRVYFVQGNSQFTIWLLCSEHELK